MIDRQPEKRSGLIGLLVLLTVGLWVSEIATIYVGQWLTGNVGPHSELDLVFRLASFSFAALLCFGLAGLFALIEDRPLALRIVAAIALSFVACAIWMAVSLVLFDAITQFGALSWTRPRSPGAHLAVIVGMSWQFLTWSAAWLAITTNVRLRERERQLATAELLAADAQNRMLRYQINPHFMFNTLSALSTLILEKQFAKADRVVNSLASFFRASLDLGARDMIPLGEEIATQTQYLAIERERFEQRLNVGFSIPHDLETSLVPAMILQPLIENAIKHGVARSSRPVAIEVAAERVDGALRLSVADDATAAPASPVPPPLGVGLTNIRERLAALYGRRASFRAGPRDDRGFEAVIVLPLKEAA